MTTNARSTKRRENDARNLEVRRIGMPPGDSAIIQVNVYPNDSERVIDIAALGAARKHIPIPRALSSCNSQIPELAASFASVP
jgi:hypothetical protein